MQVPKCFQHENNLTILLGKIFDHFQFCHLQYNLYDINIDYKNKPDLYHIDYIVDDKIENGQRFYLVKWSGYSHAENTWEPASRITDRKIILRYERRKKGKVTTDDNLHTYIYLISSTTENPYDLEFN